MVEVMQSPSILLKGMEGSRMPIAVAHGEGRDGNVGRIVVLNFLGSPIFFIIGDVVYLLIIFPY
jgi:hypothetical protein